MESGQAKVPTISVLMPAYNADPYLMVAVTSVLQQSFADFELLVLDDGSTDNTPAILASIDDPRLRVVRNDKNLGLVATLDKGLQLCRGRYIARMDADDVCLEDRFARQVAFLETNNDIGIVGGAIKFFGSNEGEAIHVFPSEQEDIRAGLLFYCTLAHPALMFRQNLISRGIFSYSNEYRHAEDYHLWSKLLNEVRAANLHECVLSYRLHRHQARSAYAADQYEASVRVRKGLLDAVGVLWSDEDIALHESIVTASYKGEWEYLNRVASWFQRIIEANRRSKYWAEDALIRLFSNKCEEIGRHLGLRRQPLAASPELIDFLKQSGYQGDTLLRYALRHAKRISRRLLMSRL